MDTNKAFRVQHKLVQKTLQRREVGPLGLTPHCCPGLRHAARANPGEPLHGRLTADSGLWRGHSQGFLLSLALIRVFFQWHMTVLKVPPGATGLPGQAGSKGPLPMPRGYGVTWGIAAVALHPGPVSVCCHSTIIQSALSFAKEAHCATKTHGHPVPLRQKARVRDLDKMPGLCRVFPKTKATPGPLALCSFLATFIFAFHANNCKGRSNGAAEPQLRNPALGRSLNSGRCFEMAGAAQVLWSTLGEPPTTSDLCSRHLGLNSGVSSQEKRPKVPPKAGKELHCLPRNPRLDLPRRKTGLPEPDPAEAGMPGRLHLHKPRRP